MSSPCFFPNSSPNAVFNVKSLTYVSWTQRLKRHILHSGWDMPQRLMGRWLCFAIRILVYALENS